MHAENMQRDYDIILSPKKVPRFAKGHDRRSVSVRDTRATYPIFNRFDAQNQKPKIWQIKKLTYTQYA